MPNKVFLEITNACNLSCSFCHGTRRSIRFIETDEFRRAATEARGFAEYLYFHLMGEPLLHPNLGEFLDIAGELGFKVILTTNGTLLRRCGDVLLSKSALFKVSISLHSFEANEKGADFTAYLDDCFSFCRSAADVGKIAVMRLWNKGGAEELNRDIIARMHEYFDRDGNNTWREIYSGYKIDEKIFKLLKSRFDKAKKIGQLKKYLKVSTDDEKREQEILSKLDDVNISGNYKEEITKVYELIFQLMKDIESKE